MRKKTEVGLIVITYFKGIGLAAILRTRGIWNFAGKTPKTDPLAGLTEVTCKMAHSSEDEDDWKPNGDDGDRVWEHSCLDAILKHAEQDIGVPVARKLQENRDESDLVFSGKVSGRDTMVFANCLSPKDTALIGFVTGNKTLVLPDHRIRTASGKKGNIKFGSDVVTMPAHEKEAVKNIFALEKRTAGHDTEF